MHCIIRNETPGDYRQVENMTREAFWNLYVPGCDEHYFTNKMREHPDFIPELDFVLEKDGKIIGNVMYTKSWLVDETGQEKEILTFGPLAIHPEYQRRGYGKTLLEHSFRAAREMGYEAIVIFGNPGNYVSRGFVSCKKRNVTLEGGLCPVAMLVKELREGALAGRNWIFRGSSADACLEDREAVAAFDAGFTPKEKAWRPTQEEFWIYSHGAIRGE